MTLARTLATALALGALAACHPAPAPAVPPPPPVVEASCHFTAEATYDSIELRAGVVSRTDFFDLEGRCAQWYAQSPCWRPEDLLTRSAPVPRAELEAFARAVRESGFLALPETTGGDPGDGRYYPYTLTVSVDGRTKSVLHRSFPGGDAPPPAFDRVWEALHALAQRAIPLPVPGAPPTVPGGVHP